MNKEFIQRLTDLVEANLSNEKFGVEDLIREMGLSHSNLHRKLKSNSNQTISQFIREIRLKKAKELLLNENLTVSEISYRVGFGSPTYFNKCFHEYFGYAPGELKNRELNHGAEEQPVDALPIKDNRRKILLALVISLIVLIPLTIFLVDKAEKAKATNAKEKSIALLPFKSLSSDPDKQYLADGMMDAILLHLSKIKDLRVISRTSVEQYRKTDKTIKMIGRELDVAYVLEGSFLKEGEQSRLILQLIRTSDESHAWVEEYDRQWKDIFSVQREVAETIASELQAVITPEEKQLIRKSPTSNLTAYDFYQRGRAEYTNYWIDQENRSALLKAQNLYRKALEYDSTFAQAYSGLAWILWDKFFWKASYLKNFTDSILVLANHALSYDNQLAEAYCLRGCCYFETGKIEQAFKEFNKAMKFDPNNCMSYIWNGNISQWIFEDYTKAIDYYFKASIRTRGKELPRILNEIGNGYRCAGFIDKAKQYFKEAYILGGDSAGYYASLGSLEFCEGNFENWLIFAKKAYAIDSNNSNYVADLAECYSFLGQDLEANVYYKKYLELSKKSEDIPLNFSHRIGYSYLKVGKFKEAEYYFNLQIKYILESNKLKRGFASSKFIYYDQAAICAVLGDKVKAYENLDELNKKQSFPRWFVSFIKYDPLFASIRQEPRFQQILKDVEAKYQAEHERVRKWLEVQEKS